MRVIDMDFVQSSGLSRKYASIMTVLLMERKG